MNNFPKSTEADTSALEQNLKRILDKLKDNRLSDAERIRLKEIAQDIIQAIGR